MRRGGEGAVLNSRAEFNRSHIPQFQVEEYDEEQAAEQEIKESIENSKDLKLADAMWEQNKREEGAKPLKELKNNLGRLKSSTGIVKR